MMISPQNEKETSLRFPFIYLFFIVSQFSWPLTREE